MDEQENVTRTSTERMANAPQMSVTKGLFHAFRRMRKGFSLLF